MWESQNWGQGTTEWWRFDETGQWLFQWRLSIEVPAFTHYSDVLVIRLLLFTYGLGLGVPILLLGTTAASLVAQLLTKKTRRAAEYILGVIMIWIGIYLLWIA